MILLLRTARFAHDVSFFAQNAIDTTTSSEISPSMLSIAEVRGISHAPPTLSRSYSFPAPGIKSSLFLPVGEARWNLVAQAFLIAGLVQTQTTDRAVLEDDFKVLFAFMFYVWLLVCFDRSK
jgi:hypothetical protein